MIFSLLALTCAPLPLCAQEEGSGKTFGAVSSSTGSGEAGTAGLDLGQGIFAPSPLRISVSVQEGYDDNVYTTHQNPIGSFFTGGSVALDYKFGSARTNLDLQVFGGATYYYFRPLGQTYDINNGLTLNISHQATPRLGFAASVDLAYQSEPNFDTGVGTNRRSGNYFYTGDKFSTSFQWLPRFSTVTSYSLSVLNYENSAIGAFEDRFEHTFGNEFRYLALPTTTLVGEYRYEIIDFATAPRDSTTHFVLAGVDHSFSPHFIVSQRFGVEFRTFDNLGEDTSPYGEATLKYSLGERTSVSWNGHYGLDEPDVPGSASRTTFRTGLNVAYAISPRVSATMAVYYQHDQNKSVTTPPFVAPAFNEDLIDLSLGLRYEINRTFTLLANYDRTEDLSDISFREYSRNRYYVGLSVAF